MAESLLSFSNVNLFGNLISELKLVDPSRPVKVAAATTGHIPSSKSYRQSLDRRRQFI